MVGHILPGIQLDDRQQPVASWLRAKNAEELLAAVPLKAVGQVIYSVFLLDSPSLVSLYPEIKATEVTFLALKTLPL